MSEFKTKVPAWFWVVAILALVWNLLGVMAYIMHINMSPEDLAALSQGERDLMAAAPAWYTGAFATAVFGSSLACIVLLLRNGLAVFLFILSLLAVLAQMTYMFFMSDTFAVMGNEAMIMPIMIVVVSILLVFFARSCKSKGWIG